MTIAPPDEFPIDAAAEARETLRRKVDRNELKLAVRHLAQGLRATIRAAPLVCLTAGVALGVAMGRRRRRSSIRRP